MRTMFALLPLLMVPTLVVADYSIPKDAKFTVTDVKVARIVVDPVGDMKPDKSFKIAAALRTPTGEKPAAGWPAVLFISGSGSQSKHGFQGPLDLGSWELLDAIAGAGFIVLSSDDRGLGDTPIGEEGIDIAELGYDELIGDARACLKHLLGHAEVNKQRIFIIGHSEGGLTAPILAGENEIAGVVFVAAMGRNMYDITLNQVEDSVASQHKVQREATMKVQREFQDAVKEGRDPNWEIAGQAAAATLKASWKSSVLPIKAWWHDHFNLDVPAIHKKVACPVLITQGKADFQVSVEKDARQIMKNVMEGECSAITYRAYDDLDHLFKPCGGKASNIKMYYEDRRVDATFIKDVVAWLKARA
jgi:uncharacterized protein